MDSPMSTNQLGEHVRNNFGFRPSASHMSVFGTVVQSNSDGSRYWEPKYSGQKLRDARQQLSKEEIAMMEHYEKSHTVPESFYLKIPSVLSAVKKAA